VVIATGAFTVIDKALAATPPAESVTLTVKEYELTVVGVPLMAPVEGFRLQPAGKEPAAIDHW
jgi:hypothetical protein